MLPHFLTSLFAAAGSSAFVFAKMQKYTGNQTKASLTVAGIVFALVFMVVLFLANTFLN